MTLRVAIGQHSEAGGGGNDDFHGAVVPGEPALTLKGIAVALADGIGSSRVSGVASALAVRAMLDDYYCTPDSWTAKASAGRVIQAVNAWLHSETRRVTGDPDRGYVCTLSALVLKGAEAHVFHIGDSRVARRDGAGLELLTEPHRVRLSSTETLLARAVGAAPHAEIDYRAVPLRPGDLFVLTTDGVHDHLSAEALLAEVDGAADLPAAARRIAARAEAAGSRDDRTVQLVRVEAVPAPDLAGLTRQLDQLPPPPPLGPGAVLDGFRVLRTLHSSARSQLHLARDADGRPAVLKVPSTELAQDPAALRRFATEEWVARRVDNPHLMKARAAPARTALYLVLEPVEGQTLAQWTRDHPRPPLAAVRAIVDQLASGLDAMHRRQMTHGDLRPDNVMIDAAGAAVIVDFGSVRVAGLAELEPAEPPPLGTALFSAPEVLLGAPASEAADVFSLAALAYHALTGQPPYGAGPARLRRPGDAGRLRWRPLRALRPDVPAWVEAALRRGLHPDPRQRTADAAGFAHALRHPGTDAVSAPPWSARDPVRFWQAVAAVLAALLLIVLAHVVNDGAPAR